jgi:hypothetical protein
VVRIRQAQGETLSEKKFAEIIMTVRGLQSVQSERALWEILGIGRKVAEVAAENGLSAANLGKTAQRLRKRAQVGNVPEAKCA